MHVKNWIVEDCAQSGYGGCRYCQALVGSEHKQGCVIRKRTVVVEVRITMVREVPEDWDQEMVEFHLNDSSWCASNIVQDLEKIVGDGEAHETHCLCSQFEGRYVREATPEDEVELGHTQGFAADEQKLLEDQREG